MSKNMPEEVRSRKFADDSRRTLLRLHHRFSDDKTIRDYRAWCREHWPEDPDAALMREVMGLLDDIRERTEYRYNIRLTYSGIAGVHTLIEWDPKRKGYVDVDVDGGPYTPKELRDKLQKMLLIPTLAEAAEAAEEIDQSYRLNVTIGNGSGMDTYLKALSAYFEAETKRRETEGEGGE